MLKRKDDECRSIDLKPIVWGQISPDRCAEECVRMFGSKCKSFSLAYLYGLGWNKCYWAKPIENTNPSCTKVSRALRFFEIEGKLCDSSAS